MSAKPAITKLQQLDLSQQYTYADYLTWQFKERVELIRGWVRQMSPAPNVRHQRISRIITQAVAALLENKPCEMFSAPFDVRLPLPPHKTKGDKTDTVVQPDIVVICDPAKLDEQGCNGAPDLVIEILSPGNTRREMKDKLELYQTAGVPEYWIVDPEHEFILVYTLDPTGKYTSSLPYTEGHTLTTPILPGFDLPVEQVFVQPGAPKY
jgi:Uma2 family endonuclease